MYTMPPCLVLRAVNHLFMRKREPVNKPSVPAVCFGYAIIASEIDRTCHQRFAPSNRGHRVAEEAQATQEEAKVLLTALDGKHWLHVEKY